MRKTEKLIAIVDSVLAQHSELRFYEISSIGLIAALALLPLKYIRLQKDLLATGFPIFVRITGILAAIPFALAAAEIFMGTEVLSTSPLPGAGYGLLTITIVGWIWTLAREKA
ncbi:MAG: hypothetical protein HQ472_00985 [Ignavibacteria bacterium]|nr:hypothetical protein [Ignavibacteria bacterium]